jgi:O-antigen ligase
MLTNSRKFHEFSQKAAFVCALTFAFFIPFGPALTNLFLFLTLVFVLLSGNLSEHIKIIWDNKVSKSAIILFSLLALGTLWSIADTSDAFRVLKKYNALLYISILIPIFSSQTRKDIGVNIFLFSMTFILAIIYLMNFGVISEFNIPIPGRDRPVNVTIDGGFQTHIITNILMAFAAYIYLIRTVLNVGLKLTFNLILFSLAAYNVLFISTGTSGQVLFAILLVLFIFQSFNKKTLAILAMFSIFSIIIGTHQSNGTSATSNASSTVEKLTSRFHELTVDSTPENVNFRPQRYINSIKMIASDPWFGSGTGSYYAAYKEKLPEIEKITTGTKWNPHNEYLSIGVQVGVAGIFLLLFLFFNQLKAASKITTSEDRYIAQGFVVLMIIGCTANSMIMDSGESHFFAYFSALLFSKIKLDE